LAQDVAARESKSSELLIMCLVYA